MDKTLKLILFVVIIVIVVLVLINLIYFFAVKPALEKASSQKCFDDFNDLFVKENSTLLYPDFVRGCCAKPFSQRKSCLNEYGLLD